MVTCDFFEEGGDALTIGVHPLGVHGRIYLGTGRASLRLTWIHPKRKHVGGVGLEDALVASPTD
jgi:hypothetical protein